MNDNMLDIRQIPKLEVSVHNQQLTNCIKQLHFQCKTQEKHLQKMKKDVEIRPTDAQLSELFTLINSNIDIDPVLAKQLGKRNEKDSDTPMVVSANKLGNKVGQMSDLIRILFQRLGNIQKRVDTITLDSKTLITDRTSIIQSQLDDFKKGQIKENRTFSQNIQLNLNKYEQKLRQVQSKTLWQINDCKTKLNDRVNQQFVRDVVREAETKILSKVKESLIKNNIDPERIDKLETRCLRLEKDIEIKMVESNAKLNDLKQNIQHSLATKKDLGNEKLDSEKKIGNLQILTAELNRKLKNIENDQNTFKEDANSEAKKQEQTTKELSKIMKMVSNLKISDDFQKLMQKLDPHKMCEIDNTLTTLADRDLKIQRKIEAMERAQQKFRQKVEICNLLNPTDQKAKLDKEQISKIFNQLIAGNASFKKIQTFQGQLYQFRAYGQLINEINKRISKIQKQFDIQGVIYNVKGLQEYIKKQLLIMNTKLTMFESQLAQQKKRRPLSARKSDSKITSSVSFKKLIPVDCISCYQNPMERTSQQRKLFSHGKY